MRNLSRIHLNGLRAVEATGRLGSLRAAADELNVTIGAVSQQILKAEAQLGRALFERHPRGLRLTPLGREIADRLTAGFGELAAAVALAEHRRDDVLTVSVAPVFAGKWLVWRLHRFNEAHPGIRIRIDANVSVVDPNASDVDICIRVGRGPWANVAAEHLLDQIVFPVCSPQIARRLQRPSDLAKVPIIRDPGSASHWNVWLGPNGLDERILGPGPIFSDASLCLDAATAGQGVFLAWDTLAAGAIAYGRLVAPFPERYPTGIAYWFVTPRVVRRPHAVRAFHDWLRVELGTMRADASCGAAD